MSESAHLTPSPADIPDRAIVFATEAHRALFEKESHIHSCLNHFLRHSDVIDPVIF